MAVTASKTETGKFEVTSTKGFPDSGDITYNREVIGYKSKTDTSFVGLTRGKYETKTLAIKAGGMLTSLDARLLPADKRDPAKLPKYMTKSFDEKNGPLLWQRQTDIYVAIVRQPDAPHLRLHNGEIQLIPGENHWETFGYRIFKDGKPLAEEPFRPGANVNLPDGGIYTAIAIEWSGLEGKPSLPLKIDKAAKLAAFSVGFWEEGAALKSEAGEATLFQPTMSEEEREKLCRGWRRAVERSRSWAEEDAAQ
jgi:hypothetical protein